MGCRAVIVLDTHAFVWYVDTPSMLSKKALSLIEFVPIDNTICRLSTSLGLHGDPADRFISATLVYLGAALITKGTKISSFLGFPSTSIAMRWISAYPSRRAGAASQVRLIAAASASWCVFPQDALAKNQVCAVATRRTTVKNQVGAVATRRTTAKNQVCAVATRRTTVKNQVGAVATRRTIM